MKKTILILAVILIASVAALNYLYEKNKALSQDVSRLRKDIEVMSEPIAYIKVNDTTLIAKHEALQAKYTELEKLRLADTKLIKQLNTRLKDTEAIHTIKTASTDTIYLQPTSTNQDTLIAYADKWISLSVNIPLKRCVYETRDSLTTIVSRTYKHKFLWWRWGTKGYQMQIVNHNPHSKVSYSKYVKVEK